MWKLERQRMIVPCGNVVREKLVLPTFHLGHRSYTTINMVKMLDDALAFNFRDMGQFCSVIVLVLPTFHLGHRSYTTISMVMMLR